MKLDRSVKYGIGSLIVEILLIIVDVYTGQTAWLKLFAIIAFCLTLGFVISKLIKKTVKNRGKQKNTAKAKVQEQAMTTEVSEINFQDNASTDSQS